MPDPILDAIDNAVRDYGISDDAMRWTPEAPEPALTTPPPAPAPRIEEIEIRVKTSDGEEITYTMQGAEQVTVSMDWEQPDLDPWDMFDTPPFVRSRRMESFTLTVGYPQDLRQTHRAG